MDCCTYIKDDRIEFLKSIRIFLDMYIIFESCAVPDGMLHAATFHHIMAFHLNLHCLLKYQFWSFQCHTF